MNMPEMPAVSIVLATYNRRDVVLNTLREIDRRRDEVAGIEVTLVDNGSTDGTPGAVRDAFVDVNILALNRNAGSCAKAFAVGRTRAPLILFLDDDSYPRPGALARMVDRFTEQPGLGAAGFVVHRPGGAFDCGALPGVFVGCGVGLRRAALRQVGGLDRTLFMQAEEYDLSFRLVRAGWTVACFDDLEVDHLKTPHGRLSGRTVFYDTRNNLLVASRYLPAPFERIAVADYLQRYRWIAENTGHPGAYQQGRQIALLRRRAERMQYARWRLDRAAFERLFRFEQIQRHMSQLSCQGVSRIVLADLGKNVYPFVAFARTQGIEVVAIADDLFARQGRFYRGVPIKPVPEALEADHDAIVVANTARCHAGRTAQRMRELADRPVHDWFGR